MSELANDWVAGVTYPMPTKSCPLHPPSHKLSLYSALPTSSSHLKGIYPPQTLAIPTTQGLDKGICPLQDSWALSSEQISDNWYAEGQL